VRQKACLSSTPQCALALARWLPGSGLARNPILVWRRRSRSCRKRLQSSLQKATEDRMPRQAASAFFLRFFLSFVVSFVSRAFICHSCCHYYLQHSKAKQQSLCCLLACLLAAAISLFLPVADAIFFKGIHCNFSSSSSILASSPPRLFSLGSVNCRDSYKSSNA